MKNTFATQKIIKLYNEKKIIYLSSIENLHSLKKIYGHDRCDYCHTLEEDLAPLDPGKISYYKNKK